MCYYVYRFLRTECQTSTVSHGWIATNYINAKQCNNCVDVLYSGNLTCCGMTAIVMCIPVRFLNVAFLCIYLVFHWGGQAVY